MRTFQMLPQAIALLALGTAAQVASATCYLVYAPDNSVVFRSLEPPVDLSLPLHLTLPPVAPGGRLVFAPDNYGCDLESNKLDSLRKVSASARIESRQTQPLSAMRRAQGT